jgi:hypothetical protein
MVPAGANAGARDNIAAMSRTNLTRRLPSAIQGYGFNHATCAHLLGQTPPFSELW